jgi:hypothetical protein
VLLVHHPHNNEASLVTSGQFLIAVIPLNHLDLPSVTLQILIHGQVTSSLTLA